MRPPILVQRLSIDSMWRCYVVEAGKDKSKSAEHASRWWQVAEQFILLGFEDTIRRSWIRRRGPTQTLFILSPQEPEIPSR